MSQPSPPGTGARVRAAMRAGDFRRLLWIRLSGQGGDGIFQAALIASVVFNPDQQNTAEGLLYASLVTILPFTLLGPFVGVFIDRWSRRKILTIAPLLKIAFVPLILFDPLHWPTKILFFAGALAVLSINRFQLAAASAVVPRLVPAEDLLIANSIATVGGTLALLVGVFLGGKVADTIGEVSVILIATLAWLVASLVAGRIQSDLAPMTLPESPELLRHAIRRIVVETWDGASTMVRTPHAIGPVASITIDQIGQGIMLTLALVVFREQLGQGVASFSNVIGAGGLGVLLGIGTAGFLEDRLPKERMVSLGFLVGGIVLIGGSFAPDGPVILLVAAVLGLDVRLEEGRSRHDDAGVAARWVPGARVLCVRLLLQRGPADRGGAGDRHDPGDEHVGHDGRRRRGLHCVDARAARDRVAPPTDRPSLDAAGVPVALQWGATHEPVVVLAADELGYRLELEDGSVIDVRRAERRPGWTVLREREG